MSDINLNSNEQNLKIRLCNSTIYSGFEGTEAFITNEEVFKCFEKSWTENFSHITSELQPRLIYVIGQTGAGKTGLVSLLTDGEKNIVVVDTDDFRKFHPNFELLSKFENSSDLTHPMAKNLYELTVMRCLDRKISFLGEATMKAKEKVEMQLKKAKSLGYSIYTNLIVARLEDSFLGSYYRAARSIEVGAAPRFVPLSIQDEAYKNIGIFSSSTESISEMNYFRIYNRNLIIILNQKIEQDKIYSSVETIKQKINYERNRERTQEEKEILNKQLEFVLMTFDKGSIKITTKENFLEEYKSRKNKISLLE